MIVILSISFIFLSVVFSSISLKLRANPSLKQLQIVPSFTALCAGKSFGSKANAEVFFCSECGTEHIRWMGRCQSCKEWNTVKPFRAAREDTVASSPLNIRARAAAIKSTTATPGTKAAGAGFSTGSQTFFPAAMGGMSGSNSSLVRMDSIVIDKAKQMFPFFSEEVNRVLGGGLVKGSVILLAGEPGIGKSTLMLQLAASLVADQHGQVVYISGEENAEQIVSRAKRLGLNVRDLFLICDIDADEAIDNILAMSAAPAMVIVDSVQTMRTSSISGSLGSVTQTRESAARFVQLAKATGSAVLLAGHVTKSGEVAGPRILEHMVDTVLYLEGSEKAQYRLLRGIKNRFGSTSEVGVLSMGEGGLVDVKNPSELFLSENIMDMGVGNEGSAVAVIMEGSRPLLAEIQCLVSTQAPQAKFNTKRMSDGFPIQRLLLICAVIEKRLRLPLWSRDIYINVAGGLRVSEPCSDLAVAMTVVSSMTGKKIRPGTALIGEVGLGGELRGGKGLEQRISEARKMGFTHIIIPRSAGFKDRGPRDSTTGGVFACKSLREALPLVFEDSDDIEAFLRPSRKQKKYGMGNYRPNPGTSDDYETELDPEDEGEDASEDGAADDSSMAGASEGMYGARARRRVPDVDDDLNTILNG